MHQSQHRAGTLCCLAMRIIQGVLCGVLLSSVPLDAQDLHHSKYQFQERRNERGIVDREEGLRPRPIAGERLDLVAAFFVPTGLPAAGAILHYRLGFFLPEDEPRVVITVRHDDTFQQANLRYLMLPKRIKFARGFQEFVWDAALAQDLKISPNALHAVARIGGQGREVVAPVLLHPAPFPARVPVQGCRFVFVPSHTMQVSAQVTLLGNVPRLMTQHAPQTWIASNTQEIVWNGKDPQGQAAPTGWYTLELSAELMPYGQPPTRLSALYEFYYTPALVK